MMELHAQIFGWSYRLTGRMSSFKVVLLVELSVEACDKSAK